MAKKMQAQKVGIDGSEITREKIIPFFILFIYLLLTQLSVNN